MISIDIYQKQDCVVVFLSVNQIPLVMHLSFQRKIPGKENIKVTIYLIV